MAKHGHDYDTAKALRLKGFNYSQIATQTKIPFEALKRYAHRHGWDEHRDKIGQIVSQHVGEQLEARATGHVLKISGFADKVIDNLISRTVSDLKLSDLQTLASVADTFDKIARRTYGLDAENAARPRVTVNVAILDKQRAAAGDVSHVFDLAPADAQVVETSDAPASVSATPAQ